MPSRTDDEVEYVNLAREGEQTIDASGGEGANFLPTLPEVVVTPRVAVRVPTAQPRPSLVARVGRLIGTALSRLDVVLLPLVPGNMGPEGTGNLPDPGPLPELPEIEIEAEPELEELPQIVVTPPPPVPPRVVDAGSDPIMPPNWNDLANPGDQIFYDSYGRRPITDPTRLPIPDFPDLGDRQAPESPSDPGELPTPSGPVVFPDLLPQPGVTTRPQTRPDPAPVLPDPFGFPDLEPFRSPFPGPSELPRPGFLSEPVRRPGSRPSSPSSPVRVPLGVPQTPIFPGVFDFPDFPNARPPNPTPPTRLGFTTDPNPSILDDPAAEPWGDVDRPTSDDQCQCDKKPKKKRKSGRREVCQQGTYTQRAKGIVYRPKRVVPCEGQIEPERDAAPARRKKPKRLKPGQFPL